MADFLLGTLATKFPVINSILHMADEYPVPTERIHVTNTCCASLMATAHLDVESRTPDFRERNCMTKCENMDFGVSLHINIVWVKLFCFQS